MGTLSPPFILCPLSNRKELLGMTEDKLQNKVIITIGKNIAIRYHILEQKQETSWTISRHWLTSPVVYCSQLEKYAAVVDNNTLALWDETDTSLQEFKKHKFTEPVLKLQTTRTIGTLVVFENGFVTTLNKATGAKNRNIAESLGIIDTKSEVIIDVDVNEINDQVILVVAKKSQNAKGERDIQMRKSLKVVTVQLGLKEDSDNKTKGNEIISALEVSQQGQQIIGHCSVISDEEKVFVYLCSDGKVYQEQLISNSTASSKSVIGYLGKYVSLKTPVVIKYIAEGSMFVIYASDSSEEGAVVFLYDLKYDLVVAKQSLKLYGTPPIMEKVSASVLVPVGLHILVLGFRAHKSLLSSVVGKHQIRSGEEVFEQRTPWDNIPVEWEVDTDPSKSVANTKTKSKSEKIFKKQMNVLKNKYPEIWEVVQQFKILELEGQPESLICSQVIPLALETKNISAIDWILDTFSDIPETFLVRILHFLLEKLPQPTSVPKKLQKGSKDKETKEVEVNSLIFGSDTRLNRLLARSCDERELIRVLPSLNYESVRKLILYLKSMMEYSWSLTSGQEVHEVAAGAWMKWISALLDAHYTKFVFNNEIELIEEILSIVEEKSRVMEAIEELQPYLALTYNKVSFEPRPNPNSKWRSEILTFI